LLSAPIGLNRSWQSREQSRLANSCDFIRVVGSVRGCSRSFAANEGDLQAWQPALNRQLLRPHSCRDGGQ
jgi:hypothetical protein